MKKDMNKYSLLVAVLLLIVACTRNDEPVMMKAPSLGGPSIDLSTDVSADNADGNYGQILSSFRVGDQLGVFAVEYERDTMDIVEMDRLTKKEHFYSSSDSYIFNSLYLYNAQGGLDSTLPVPQYFPSGSTVGLAFYAYYPHNSVVSYYKGREYGWTFKWSLSSKLKDTPDYMYSGPTFVDGDDRLHVALKPMKHVMTAVRIYMSTTDPEIAKKKLNDIQVGFYGGKSGVMHIDNGFIEYDNLGVIKNRYMWTGLSENGGAYPTLVNTADEKPAEPIVSFVLAPGTNITSLYASGGITGTIYPNNNIPTDALDNLKAGVVTSYYFNVQKRNTRSAAPDNCMNERGEIDLEDYKVDVTVIREER